MIPTQREAALRLIEGGEPSNRLMPDELEAWADDAAALLRELAADPVVNQSLTTEPQSEPVGYMPAVGLNHLRSGSGPVGVWPTQAEGYEPVYVAPQPQATEPSQDTPPQSEPVAWMNILDGGYKCLTDKPIVGWTPLYAAPQQRKPLVDEIVRPLIDDTSEVFDANGPETPQVVRDVIEYVQSWLEVYFDKRGETP